MRILLALLGQVRIRVLHHVDDDARRDVHEGLATAEQAPVTNRPAQNAAQDVAAALVGGRDAVGDQERHRPGVVRDDLIAEPLGFEGLGIVADQVAHGGVDRREEIRVVVGGDLLDHAREPLEAHARVHGLHRQRNPRPVRALLELHEDEVPDLQPARAVFGVVRDAFRPFAELGAAVVMDLRTAAAGTRIGHPPEVRVVPGVHVAPTGDTFGRQAYLVAPHVVGFVIVRVDGSCQTVPRDAIYLGKQLPGPVDGLALEVVAEAPVAEHLEERVVTRSPADLFEVIVLARDAQAALVVRGTDVAPLLSTGEHVFELDHPGVREQQGLIAGRNQRSARHLGMATLDKELDIAAPNLSRGEVRNRQVRHRC